MNAEDLYWLIKLIKGALPEAELAYDEDGQLILYTGIYEAEEYERRRAEEQA